MQLEFESNRSEKTEFSPCIFVVEFSLTYQVVHMLIIIIGILISVALFYYFQQKQSNRNIEQFEKRRDRYYQMLEQLKKNKEQNGEVK